MAKDYTLPFPVGSTLYDASQTPPTTSQRPELEGKCFTVEDNDAVFGISGHRTGKSRRLMVVRNVSAAAILPKQLCEMKNNGTGKEFVGQASGIAATVGELAYPADEFLPAAGARINDLFYVVVEGPATVTTDTAGDTTINPGEWVIPGATTAGRVIGQDTTVAAGAATFNQIQGAIGRCITPVAGVSTDFLVDIIPKSGRA